MTTSSSAPDPLLVKILTLAGNPPQELRRDNIVALRPGYTIPLSGSPIPTLIVLTNGIQSVNVPPSIDGIPVRVQPADPEELLLGPTILAAWRAILSPAGPKEERPPPSIGYQPPTDATLDECEVSGITCHVGPDSGWSTLEPFLNQTLRTLSVSMYDFDAPQIIDSMLGLATGSASLEMILQVDKDAERNAVTNLQSAWGDRFQFSRAVVSGPHRVFANSYHTKVAVRDGKSFWLSSGNWSRNSQPVVPEGDQPRAYKLGNREWHIIINDETLAGILETYIKHDFAQATAAAAAPEAAPIMPDLFVPDIPEEEAAATQPHRFDARTFDQPIKVQPLMTPDNYSDFMIPLIESAQETLWMQYAYIRAPKDNDKYMDLVKAVAERMAAGVDVRVITDRRNEKQADIDGLIALGWKPPMMRLQTSAVHNKGIIVDGQIAVVGSQNWSPDGTQFNRDASLIMHSPEVAAYFAEVFDFDWTRLTKSLTSTGPAPIAAPEGAPTPEGMKRVSWNEWYHN